MPTPSSTSTPSIWIDSVQIPRHNALASNCRTDVLIVGAGIAGMTAAYLLCKEGRNVIVVDSNHVGGGETSHTTAHLTNEIDDRHYEIERIHGSDGMRIAAESQTGAIDEVERIVNELQIDCDFKRVDGYLFAAEQEHESMLDKELEAATRAGIRGVAKLGSIPGVPFESGAALRFPMQAQFHPLKYLAGLQEAILKSGGEIYEQTRITEFAPKERRAKSSKPPLIIAKTESGFEIQAHVAIVATNSPVNDWVTMHTKQAPYRTYVIGLEIPTDSFEPMLIWDTATPYHYVRTQQVEGKTILIVGGEDHKTAQEVAREYPEHFERLDAWARARFPFAAERLYQWSGQVLEPVDGLAFLGKNPGDETETYIITGDSGMGMTNCTAGAMIVRDLIMGRTNPWAACYDPSRKSLRAMGEFIEENVNALLQMADWVLGGDTPSARLIERGTGAIVSHGLEKLAVYRDEKGALHEYSAKCPHLGCVVHWNPVESSWDCPCHGSRFGTTGEVINGPALAGLQRIRETNPKK